MIVLTAGALSSTASVITSNEVIPMPASAIGSGNGTLDFVLLTESNGGSSNHHAGFDADDANTSLPTGNSNLTANESFITSMGELRAFYRLNFPDGSGGSTVNQIAVFVDVNQTGQPQHINLDRFDVWIDYTQAFGDGRDNPHLVDLSPSLQNMTDGNFSGGTLAAYLDSSPKVLWQQNVGAGHADYVIFTGVNPFDAAFTDSTRFLLHWGSSDHDNGGETVFVSGTFAPQDIVPEPATLALLGISALAVVRRQSAGSRRRSPQA